MTFNFPGNRSTPKALGFLAGLCSKTMPGVANEVLQEMLSLVVMDWQSRPLIGSPEDKTVWS